MLGMNCSSIPGKCSAIKLHPHPLQLFAFTFVVGVPGRVAVSTMAVGEPGLASKPASPAAGPTQVRLRCRGTQRQMVRC